MRQFLWAAIITAGLSATAAAAADPGPYPGSRVDPDIARQALEAAPLGRGPAAVLVTSDSFDQVLAFYKAAGTEVRLPTRPGQPDTGHERELPADIKGGKPLGPPLKIKQATVLLDGTKELTDSKNWVTIIRPFIFNVTLVGERFVYDDIRDITVIVQSKE
jgi:hypothetical protein